MRYFILSVVSIAALLLLMMNIIATVSVARTRQLSLRQKISQVAFVWFVPFVGAMLVTHLLAESDPSVVYRHWIPNATINAYVLQALTFQARESLRGMRIASEDSLIDAFSSDSDHSGSDHSGGGGDGD